MPPMSGQANKSGRTKRKESETKYRGGKTVPTRLECLPRTKPGEKTVIKYHDLAFDTAIPETMFSLERLQKSRE